MRPPLNTGEDGADPGTTHARAEASMRPPLNTGEDGRRGVHRGCCRRASMRPPLNTGEDAAPNEEIPPGARLQ